MLVNGSPNSIHYGCQVITTKTWEITFTVMVDIVQPENFPVYIGVGEQLQLGCTAEPTGGTYSWSKVSGPGNVDFLPNDETEDPTFTADTPGVYTVKVQYTKDGNIASDTSGDIYVVGVDLGMDVDDDGDIDTTDEDTEETEGAYIFYNWDDDNNNGIPDNDITEDIVWGENDTVKITLDVLPSLNTGTVKLEASGGHIKVWGSGYIKGVEIPLPTTWDLASETVPSELWVEGFERSTSQRDVQLKLSYTNGSFTCEDKIKITVVDLKLGTAVYRKLATPWTPEFVDYNHNGIVVRYIGSRTRQDIKDMSNYLVYDMQQAGMRTGTTLQTFSIEMGEGNYYGEYSTSNLTDSKRIKVLNTAEYLKGRGLAYPDEINPYAVKIGTQQLPESSITIDQITALRCDALIEVCYEESSMGADINVWWCVEGANNYYSIMDWPQKHNNRVDGPPEHPEYEFSPKAQRGAFDNSNTTFTSSALYTPTLE